MAKERNGIIKILSIVVGLLVIFASAVAGWVTMDKDIEAVEKDVKVHMAQAIRLGTDGCYPAQANKFELVGVKKDISVIQSDIEGIRLEQREGFKEILSRLPEK